MKVIQARRERQDKISKLMGDYLLKGYKMLGEACEVCGVSEAGRCAVFVRLGELASDMLSRYFIKYAIIIFLSIEKYQRADDCSSQPAANKMQTA